MVPTKPTRPSTAGRKHCELFKDQMKNHHYFKHKRLTENNNKSRYLNVKSDKYAKFKTPNAGWASTITDKNEYKEDIKNTKYLLNLSKNIPNNMIPQSIVNKLKKKAAEAKKRSEQKRSRFMNTTMDKYRGFKTDNINVEPMENIYTDLKYQKVKKLREEAYLRRQKRLNKTINSNNITLPKIDPTNTDKTKTDSFPERPRRLSSSLDGIIGSRTIRKTLYRPGKNHTGIINQNCSNKKQLKSSIDGVLGFRNYIKSND